MENEYMKERRIEKDREDSDRDERREAGGLGYMEE